MTNEHVLFIIIRNGGKFCKHLICKRAIQKFTIFTNLDRLSPSDSPKSLIRCCYEFATRLIRLGHTINIMEVAWTFYHYWEPNPRLYSMIVTTSLLIGMNFTEIQGEHHPVICL